MQREKQSKKSRLRKKKIFRVREADEKVIGRAVERGLVISEVCRNALIKEAQRVLKTK